MYRLIHIEPDEAASRTVLHALADSPLPFAIDRVDDPEAAADILAETTVDAVLLSVAAETAALDLLARCRSVFATHPLIVIAASADLGFARAALRAGAQDVVVRHEKALAVLSRILLYAIERAGAEMLRRNLELKASTLEAVADAVFAETSDGIVQLDASGTIQRLSPTAASLLGLAWPPPPGYKLVSRVRQRDAERLQTLLEKAGHSGDRPSASTFGFAVEGATRILEVRPLPLSQARDAAACLLELSELAADLADDAPAPVEARGTLAPRPAGPLGPERATTSPSARTAGGVGLMERPVKASTAAAAAAPMAASVRPMALIDALDRAACWRIARSAGGSADWGFLVADPKSAPALARLAIVSRDDADVALALDELHVRAWRKLAAATPDQLPALVALEVSYATAASRPHLERFLATAAEPPGQLFKRAPPVLGRLPKGVHVPTLAKMLRLLASRHGKPALQLPALDADLRALPLGELALLILDVDELKQALAKSSKAVSAFLAQAAQHGCPTLIRGAGGSLAEALRSRLGVDLTVEG
jgi:DNA-binding response OmpR family regulator